MSSAENKQIALLILSFAITAVFSFILIYRTHYANDYQKYSVVEAHGEHYLGFWQDVKLLFKSETATLLCIAGINVFCWAATALDLALFSKRTVSVVLIIYSPMQFAVESLPSWMPNIVGYLIGIIFVCTTYILELALFRRKWYNSYRDK